jgi:hypothetical protein
MQYEDTYPLAYIRGPEGILVALAEQSGQYRPPEILSGFLALLRSALRAGETSLFRWGFAPTPAPATRSHLAPPEHGLSQAKLLAAGV